MMQSVSRAACRRASAMGIGLLLLIGSFGLNSVHGQEMDEVGQEVGEVMNADEMTQAVASLGGGLDRRETLLASLTIFVLAVFLGFELITKVPPTLHTPLMSGSNAISGITLVGAVLAAGTDTASWMIPFLGLLAVIMATVNVVGGFAVTHRMLAMFRRK